MGRKSIASKIVNSLKEDDDDSRWLVCYDFDVDIPLVDSTEIVIC
jgi:hypothetical protein